MTDVVSCYARNLAPVRALRSCCSDDQESFLNLQRFPPFINIYVLRASDFVASVLCFLASIGVVLGWFVFPASDSSTIHNVFEILQGMLSLTLVFTKIRQAIYMPTWKFERRLAYTWYGDKFSPVHSNARRLQQFAFSIEGIPTCGPIVRWLLTTDDTGFQTNLDQTMVGTALFAYCLFFGVFYLIMAKWSWCPLWSLTGMLVQKGCMAKPAAAQCPFSEDSYWARFDSVRCTHIRYGHGGRMVDITP